MKKQIVSKSNFSNNIRYYLVLLLCAYSLSISAQLTDKFPIAMKFVIEGGDFKNSQILITKDGGPFRTIKATKTKNPVQLPFGSKYIFTFTKLGYVTKSIIVDTHIPVNRNKEPFAKFGMLVKIQKQSEDKVLTYTQPVGRIKYSDETTDFGFDKDYSLVVEEMKKKAIANAKPKPKPPEPRTQREAPSTAKREYGPSNPVPVKVEENKYKPAPVKKKQPVKRVVTPQKPLVKNKTVKVLQEDRRKITMVTITINDVDCFYKKEEYSWGGIYYYKNNNRVTELTYDKETE